MDKIQHDFIIIEPNISKGVLKQDDSNINSGIVKGFGAGYYENSYFTPNISVAIGDNIIFTQSFKLTVNGQDMYITRGRDVIKIKDDAKV